MLNKKRKKAEKKVMNEEEFKQALFNWALKHDPSEHYIDDDEGILGVIEKYQENLPKVMLAFEIQGGEIPRLLKSLDDLDVSEATRKALRAAVPQ